MQSAAGLSAQFRSSADRLQEDICALRQSLELHERLHEPSEPHLATVVQSLARSHLPQGVEAACVAPPPVPADEWHAERAAVTRRSAALALALQERDRQLAELTERLECVAREEAQRSARLASSSAELRRHAAALHMPAPESLELTPSGVLSLLGAAQRAHAAELGAAQLEARRLALEVQRAESQALQVSRERSTAEEALGSQAAVLAELERRHAQEQDAAAQRVAALEAENGSLLRAAHRRLDDEQAGLQRLLSRLGVSDAEELEATVARLSTMASSVPSLEAFVRQVCAVVYGDGLAYVEDGAPKSAIAVPPILRAWTSRLRERERLEQFRAVVAHELARLPGARLPRGCSDAVLAAALRVAVSAEQRRQNGSFGRVHADIVAHLQVLFDVPVLAGAIPKLSKVHSSLQELSTFARTLRMLLGLQPSTPLHAVYDCVRVLAGQPREV